MKPRGIPIAQIDSGADSDPKLMRLRMDHPGAYHEAFGIYMILVLHAWATASRAADPDLVLMCPAESLGLLRTYGLLDPDSCIPEQVFDKYVGEVLRSRALEADRRRVRRSPPDTAGVQRSPAESADSSSPLLSSSISSAAPAPAREELSTSVLGPEDEEWQVLAPVLAELTGRLYHNRFSGTASMLVEDAVDFGSERVVEVMRAAAGAMSARPDLRALAFGVRNVLRAPPDGREIVAAERQTKERESFERRVEATRRKAAELRGE